MYIRNYQIHNVLVAYQKQLIKRVLTNKRSIHFKTQFGLSGNRQAVINKVMASVLKKINHIESDYKFVGEGKNNLKNKLNQNGKNEYKNLKKIEI
jgi:hypothetical protein